MPSDPDAIQDVFDSPFGADLFNLYTMERRRPDLLFSKRLQVVKAMIAVMLATEAETEHTP